MRPRNDTRGTHVGAPIDTPSELYQWQVEPVYFTGFENTPLHQSPACVTEYNVLFLFALLSLSFPPLSSLDQ